MVEVLIFLALAAIAFFLYQIMVNGRATIEVERQRIHLENSENMEVTTQVDWDDFKSFAAEVFSAGVEHEDDGDQIVKAWEEIYSKKTGAGGLTFRLIMKECAKFGATAKDPLLVAELFVLRAYQIYDRRLFLVTKGDKIKAQTTLNQAVLEITKKYDIKPIKVNGATRYKRMQKS